LIVIWEASDRICGERLRPLVPILIETMERHGHLHLAPEVRTGLLAMSAATIDLALRDVRERAGGRKRRRSPPSAVIRRSVAVRTFDGWDDPPPGFVEADLVAHSGPTAKGSFVQTLTLTDIATGWTECAPLLVREQKLLSAMRERMPFALRGFDTDNDSVFMNETVKTYCEEAGLVFDAHDLPSDFAHGATTGAGTGASAGAAIGGGAGPLVAAGWLVATAVGAVAGAAAGGATGGLIGLLTSAGVSKDHTNFYAEAVRRGASLVTARVDEALLATAEAIMQRHGRIDPTTREKAYRDGGWSEFDEKSVPYTPADVARERAFHSTRPSI
jgi:hypothetical protein